MENVKRGAAAASENPSIDAALRVFQRRTIRTLSREDGRESLANLTGFCAELLAWRREDEAAARAAKGAR